MPDDNNKPRRKVAGQQNEATQTQGGASFTRTTYLQVAFICDEGEETRLLRPGDNLGTGEWFGQPVDLSWIKHPIVSGNKLHPEEVLDVYLNQEGDVAIVFVLIVYLKNNRVSSERTEKIYKKKS